MFRNNTLAQKIARRISRKKCSVLLREDFEDLAGYDQVGRALHNLVAEGQIIKIGYGLYSKAEISPFTGKTIPADGLPSLAIEALNRLGIETAASSLEKDYNSGKSTQVPTGRLIAIKGRVSRKIGYNGAYVSFEKIAK